MLFCFLIWVLLYDYVQFVKIIEQYTFDMCAFNFNPIKKLKNA